MRARILQAERYTRLGLPEETTNASAPAAAIEDVAALDGSATAFVRTAADKMRLTARGFHRVLKLARTLADLDASSKVRREHLSEALSYRPRESKGRQAA